MPRDASVRHRLQEGFLLRLARRPEPDVFVLRGGMCLRHRFPRSHRTALDVDLVCPVLIGARELEERLRVVLAEERVRDGVQFEPHRLRLDAMGELGYRLLAAGRVDGVGMDLVVDVRMGLPLWPPPQPEPLVTERGTGSLWMCRPETQVGRKVQVTTELGSRACRPKDLLDLYWLLTEPPSSAWSLGEAIEAAFEGHPGDVGRAREVFGALRGPRLAAVRAGLAPVLGAL